MLEAFRLIRNQEAQLSQPIFAVHGARDEVCPLTFVQRLLDNCGSQDKTLKVYPDALHDTLHDYDKDEICQDIVAWLDARTPVAGSAV